MNNLVYFIDRNSLKSNVHCILLHHYCFNMPCILMQRVLVSDPPISRGNARLHEQHAA